MSIHHRKSKHTTHAPGLRAKIARMLPLPCVECGQPVTADQSWHLAHIKPAMLGGKTTAGNTGVAHARCNLRSGGRMGAAVVNARKTNEIPGRRKW